MRGHDRVQFEKELLQKHLLKLLKASIWLALTNLACKYPMRHPVCVGFCRIQRGQRRTDTNPHGVRLGVNQPQLCISLERTEDQSEKSFHQQSKT